MGRNGDRDEEATDDEVLENFCFRQLDTEDQLKQLLAFGSHTESLTRAELARTGTPFFLPLTRVLKPTHLSSQVKRNKESIPNRNGWSIAIWSNIHGRNIPHLVIDCARKPHQLWRHPPKAKENPNSMDTKGSMFKLVTR